jgi:hypothetical protein
LGDCGGGGGVSVPMVGVRYGDGKQGFGRSVECLSSAG